MEASVNPSPEAIAWISDHADWSKGDAEILASLNASAVANPVAVAPRVPRPFTINDLITALNDPAAVAAVGSFPSFPSVLDSVKANDRPACSLWITLFAAAGKISQSQSASLKAVLDDTLPDPSWSATIGYARASIGRDVDLGDIASARDAGGE